MDLKSIFSAKSLSQATPWLVSFLGLAFFVISVFVDFTNKEAQSILNGLGKTMLASGIFAFILKTQQMLGVYKDELTKVIFEPKFLQNRNDLVDFWEKTTFELFKHKFPGINKKITKDVMDIYLPTQSVQYYDNTKLYIDIKMIDPEKQLIEVTQTSRFTIIPCDKEEFDHNFENNIHTGGYNEDYSYELQKFKVNDKEQQLTLKTTNFPTYVKTEYSVKLAGKEGYNIEFTAKKRYSLKYDNIIGNVSTYFRNNFTVTFHYSGVELTFLEVGTLNKFKTNNQVKGLLVKEYNGVVYPRQGYLTIIKDSNAK